MRYATFNELAREEARISASFEADERIKALPDPAGVLEKAFGVSPDPWQRHYLKSSVSSAALAVVACRQTGKSTVGGTIAAWLMLTFPGFVVIVCSRSLRQASEFMSKVRVAIFAFVDPDFASHNNTLGVILRNGSRILAVPCQGADAARGFSPDLLIVDEAAFVPDEVFTALLPALTATQGAVHLISSPNGRAGLFFEAVEGAGSAEFVNYRVRASEIGRFDADFLARQRRLLGDIRYRQEFEAEFLTLEGAFFNAETTKMIFNGEEIDEADMTRADYMDIVAFEMDDMMAAMDTTMKRGGATPYA